MALRFLIARSIEFEDTPAALDRFGAQLGHEIGQPVSVELVASYGELRKALMRGEAQLAWLPPILLADGNEQRLLPLVTAQRNGASEYCSVLFVRAESDVFDLSDLKGAMVAWVDRCSAAGYLLPRMHLIAEGFRPERLFGAECFYGSHGAAVRAVFSGEADVGATFGGPPGARDADDRSGFAGIEPRQPVRVIFRSGAVPADAVVCDARVPQSTRLLLTAALLKLGTFAVGRAVTRRVFGADAFVPHDAKTLESLRTLVTGARARGWLPPE